MPYDVIPGAGVPQADPLAGAGSDCSAAP
jgi:hypothetical protein